MNATRFFSALVVLLALVLSFSSAPVSAGSWPSGSIPVISSTAHQKLEAALLDRLSITPSAGDNLMMSSQAQSISIEN